MGSHVRVILVSDTPKLSNPFMKLRSQTLTTPLVSLKSCSLSLVTMHQPSWMCTNPNCGLRNRLLHDTRLTTSHICTNPPPLPVFVNPFPPKPMTILPPPPLAPAPPGSFYFPPPFPPPSGPCPFFPIPGPPLSAMPPAPMPPGPFMLPGAPPAPPAEHTPPQLPPPEQNALPPASPKKPPSIDSIIHGKSVHTYKAKKGSASKRDKEALSDFEERTRRQEYRDLAESSKKPSSEKSQGKPSGQPPAEPRSILKGRQPSKPTVNQEVHVNVYNGGQKAKAAANNNAVDSSSSNKSVPAKDAASIREQAIKRAHSLAQGVAAATAPAAMMSGALKPPSQQGCHASAKAASHASQPAPPGSIKAPSHVSKPPSHTSAKPASNASHPASTKAPSHVSQPASHTSAKPPTQNSKPTPSNPPSTVKASTHRSNASRPRHNNPLPLALAAATANAQVSPPSIESWRESVRRAVPA
jgi:hypothetical protein